MDRDVVLWLTAGYRGPTQPWRALRIVHVADKCDDMPVSHCDNIETMSVESLRLRAKALEALDEVGRMLAAELDLTRLVQAITDASTKLAEAEFGAFFYNVINERG